MEPVAGPVQGDGMKISIRAVLAAVAVVLATASMAMAAKTFTVAPFVVNGSSAYKYLEKSTPDMFASRLYWQGTFEPAKKAGTNKPLQPTDEAAAASALAASGADYIIWGSITIVGDTSSIDVRARDKAGKTWPISRESSVSQLIPGLRQVADNISAEVFQKPRASRSRQQQQPVERVNQMNPDLVRNETTPAEVYINPNFRYSGKSDDESRLRSQTLPFASYGMEICDATGDGQKEVFLLEEKKINAYHFEQDGKLKLLGSFSLPSSQYGLSIRSIELNREGRNTLIVNSKDDDEELVSRLLTFDGQAFKEISRNNGIFLNVVNMPPTYKPRLVGQRSNPPHLFQPGVSEADLKNGKIVLGAKLNLPSEFLVFNFSYVPPGAEMGDMAKIIMLDESERLRLYSEKGARMAITDDKYSGSVQGIYVDAAMPGMGKEHVTIGTTYYVPMRMLVVDLDQDGNYEIIVNKPITTAGVIFDNYRTFPQSEIHSLQWDGLGLSLVWKTRRIKGTVVDYTIDDPNHDGVLDLVVCVNTHPGALGAVPRKTMVLLYPLDLSKANPDTPPSFVE